MNDINNSTDGSEVENEQQPTPRGDQINGTTSAGEQQPTQREPVKESPAKPQDKKQDEDVAPPTGDSYDINDLFPNISDIPVGEEEKNMMSSLVKKFSHIGMTRQQALDVFQELKKYASEGTDAPPDPEKIFSVEMEKLGHEKDTILSSLRSFSDTMVANRLWDEGKKKSFYDTVTTAHTARLFYDVIAHGNLARAGNFSHASTSPTQAPQFSSEERRDMYRKAFEMGKTNPTDGDLEIKRLDRLFGMK